MQLKKKIKKITNNYVYFLTYKDLVFIYNKYPDFIGLVHLLLYPESYLQPLGSKYYFINPFNPKKFITDVTNNPYIINHHQKMNEFLQYYHKYYNIINQRIKTKDRDLK